ncbi:MAG: superinfection immunity protein [Hafnia sp.]
MAVLGTIFLALSAVIALALYLTPTMIALGREHRHQYVIGAVNVCFGWTVLVWLLCLVWSALPVRPKEH